MWRHFSWMNNASQILTWGNFSKVDGVDGHISLSTLHYPKEHLWSNARKKGGGGGGMRYRGKRRREGKGRNLFVLITENTTCAGKGRRPTLLYATRPPSHTIFFLQLYAYYITFGYSVASGMFWQNAMDMQAMGESPCPAQQGISTRGCILIRHKVFLSDIWLWFFCLTLT